MTETQTKFLNDKLAALETAHEKLKVESRADHQNWSIERTRLKREAAVLRFLVDQLINKYADQ